MEFSDKLRNIEALLHTLGISDYRKSGNLATLTIETCEITDGSGEACFLKDGQIHLLHQHAPANAADDKLQHRTLHQNDFYHKRAHVEMANH